MFLFYIHRQSTYSSIVKTFLLRVTTIFLSITSLCWGYSPSEGNVTAYVGPFFEKTAVTEKSNAPSAPNELGLGLVALGDINDKSSLEIALLLFDKDYYREDSGKYIGENTRLVHITMGYRRWFSNYLSASVSFFSAYPMGDVIVTRNDFATGTEIPTSARDATEYGFDIALQTEVWQDDLNAVVLDLRYSKSTTPKDSEDADHYGVLLGYRYLLQEKRHNAKLK
jgi:hypothetical protein